MTTVRVRAVLLTALLLVTSVSVTASRAALPGLSLPSLPSAFPVPDADPFYAVPANVGSLPNGAIIRSRPVTATATSLPLPARSWQVLYKTTDNLGAPTATVTTVMVPLLPPPGPGARPVLSYQIAEDAAGTKCAPSYLLRAGLSASVGLTSVDTTLIDLALLRGWTVVAPDHEGPQSMFLGAAGAAHMVLDGLRAARSFAPADIPPSAPLALWGYSGGATASTDAAQLQPTYAPDLKLAGVALGGVLADARASLPHTDGTPFGGEIVIGLITLDRAYPEFHLQQYLNAAGRAAFSASQNDCAEDILTKYPLASLSEFTDDPSFFFSPALAPMFQQADAVTFAGLPQAPVYDYHATQDELVPVEQDRALVARFCRAGVTVQHVEALGDHTTEALLGAPGAMDWLSARFAGQPAPDNCPS